MKSIVGTHKNKIDLLIPHFAKFIRINYIIF